VLWIAVQLHGTHLDAWVICLRDGLGQVEDVVTVGLGIFVWNDLNVELPGWIVATRNRLVEITTGCSASTPAILSASSFERCSRPWFVRKWKRTQKRSPS